MASESIGAIYPTKIPGYVDNADVQAAFRLYHYGSTTNDTANTNVGILETTSIAYALNNLQTQITAITPVDVNIIDAKGDLLIGSANNAADNLAVGSNNYVLTADSAQTLGVKWAAPDVTLTNTATLTNKTLTTPVISSISNSGTVTLPTGSVTLASLTGTETFTNKTLTSPVLTTPSISTMTTTGDILYASAASTPARLGIGTEGFVLTVSSGLPVWSASSGGGGSASLPDIFLLGGM